jgi:methyl farnesoate epoxidase/farnesoate epoxidase
MQNLAKTYGPVTGFYIGPKAFISVVGPEAVREALQNNDLNSRPSGTPLIRSLTFGKELGIIKKYFHSI